MQRLGGEMKKQQATASASASAASREVSLLFRTFSVCFHLHTLSLPLFFSPTISQKLFNNLNSNKK